jgi:anti-sigma B factor antagonist
VISTRKQGDVTILLSDVDHLDASNSKQFKQEVQPLISGSAKLLLDASTLKFVDSSGLGAILSVLRDLKKQGGDLKIASPTAAIQVLFDLVRLERIVGVYASREDAVAAFDG